MAMGMNARCISGTLSKSDAATNCLVMESCEAAFARTQRFLALSVCTPSPVATVSKGCRRSPLDAAVRASSSKNARLPSSRPSAHLSSMRYTSGRVMAVSPADLRRTLAARVVRSRARAEARRAGAVDAARAVCRELVREGAIGEAWLIGSAAWGAFGDRSDIDIVVRGLASGDAVSLSDRLADRARIEVDLLRWEELHETFRSRILAEGERLA